MIEILACNQSGFRSYSCATAFASVHGDVFFHLVMRINYLILLDFSCAFDTVHHTLVQSILPVAKFSDGVQFIGNYLQGCSQCVQLPLAMSVLLECLKA